MTNIITQLSKYILILLMVIYTIRCCLAFRTMSQRRRRRAFSGQTALMLMMHFILNLQIFLHTMTVSSLIFYVAQLSFFGVALFLYRNIYRDASVMLISNMFFLLMLGFCILTRLDFTLAVKQFVIAVVSVMLSLFVPVIVSKVRLLSHLSIVYGVIGIALVASVFVAGKNVYGATNWVSIGGLAFVRPGMRVAVKLNLVAAMKPETAATVHPALVCALTRLLREKGAEVVLGDSPGGLFNAPALRRVYEVCGIRAAEACGAELNVSLLLNRFFREDAAALDRVIRELKPDFIYFAVPNYTPHARMMGFEDYRARLSDLIALSPLLRDWGQDAEALLAQAEQSTPGAAAERLERGLDLQGLFRQEQQVLYGTVRQDRRLYLCNTGAETALLGDLRTLDPALAAERLSREPGNRDYTAFYDPDTLPEAGTLAEALRRLPADRLYSDEASVLYRGLAALGVPTRILAL